MSIAVHVNTSEIVPSLGRMVGVLLFIFGMAAFTHCGTGCLDRQAQTPNEIMERNYTTEVVACAATAGYPGAYDRDLDMRCRAKVDCRYKLGPCP